MTITEFLLARIEEDEADIRLHFCEPGFEVRGLAECAAKRAVLKSYRSCVAAESTTRDFGPKLVTSGMAKGLELAVKHLASAYHTHPEYERDWADELIRGRKSE